MVAAIGVLIGLFSPSAYAQREPGSLTVGPQVGQTSGLTVKLYRRPEVAYDLLFTFGGNDGTRLSLFRVRERPLPDSLVHVYYGPGLVLGSGVLTVGSDRTVGVGASIGLNFYAERFEVFLHLTPMVHLHPALAPHLSGGAGLRYDLYQP